MTVVLRMMWKDWGFAEKLFSQAQAFLQLASDPTKTELAEAYIRAAIVFFQMAFEAYYRDAVRVFISQNRGLTTTAAVATVEKGLKANTAIKKAVDEWPQLLTGNPLPNGPAYTDFVNFLHYRNALVHGSVTAPIAGWGILAQEVETSAYGTRAQTTCTEMVKMVAATFGLPLPPWA